MNHSSRRDFLKTSAAAAAAIFSASAKAQPAAPKPNVIIIFCDDMGYGDIGVNGAKGYSTPNIDRLAAEGMLFSDFYVGRSVCSPSRAAIMTGCYPLRVGVFTNFSPRSRNGLNPEEMTIANVVKQSGYATAMFGKWHLGHLPPFLPTKQGFDEYYGLPYSNDMWPFHPDPRYNFPDLPLMEGEKILEYNPDETQLTGTYTRRAIDFIRRKKEGPFFIYLAHAMPHVPLYASDAFNGKTERGEFGDVLEEIDWSVGQILDTLKNEGIDENTLVVFTSDNGPWLLYCDHGGSAGPFREGKNTMFEGGMRVPGVMRWPGRLKEGLRIDGLEYTLDLHATILDLAGIKVPEDILSESLLPVAEGKSQRAHDTVYGAVFAHAPARYKGAQPRSPERDVYALHARDKRWKYILYTQALTPQNADYTWMVHQLCDALTRAKGQENLYDLSVDAYETNDLASDPANKERLEKFREGVLAWWERTGGKPLEDLKRK